MPAVIGIQRPEGPSPSGDVSASQPDRDGAFAKELTRQSALVAPRLPLAPTRTHLSGQEAAKALGDAWQQRFGHPAPAGTLEVLVADWAHETGHGRAMMNYNFGGIKGTGPSGLSAAYLTHEGSGAAEHKVVDRFRAYRDATEGASDYVGLLAERFPKALDAARRGDAGEFVRALKQGGYFTGSEEAYTSSVVSLANQAHALGFDALGSSKNGAPGEFTRASLAPAVATSGIDSTSAANLIASGAAHLYATAGTPALQTLARAGTLEMTDELSRAALRIAASESKKTDEEF